MSIALCKRSLTVEFRILTTVERNRQSVEQLINPKAVNLRRTETVIIFLGVAIFSMFYDIIYFQASLRRFTRTDLCAS